MPLRAIGGPGVITEACCLHSFTNFAVSYGCSTYPIASSPFQKLPNLSAELHHDLLKPILKNAHYSSQQMAQTHSQKQRSIVNAPHASQTTSSTGTPACVSEPRRANVHRSHLKTNTAKSGCATKNSGQVQRCTRPERLERTYTIRNSACVRLSLRFPLQTTDESHQSCGSKAPGSRKEPAARARAHRQS